MPEDVPGLMTERNPNALEIIEIDTQIEATVTARRPSDTTLVEGNALELGKQGSVGAPHVVRHSGPTVQEEQRFTVRIIPFDREDGTGGVHTRSAHAPIVGRLRPLRPGPSDPMTIGELAFCRDATSDISRHWRNPCVPARLAFASAPSGWVPLDG